MDRGAGAAPACRQGGGGLRSQLHREARQTLPVAATAGQGPQTWGNVTRTQVSRETGRAPGWQQLAVDHPGGAAGAAAGPRVAAERFTSRQGPAITGPRASRPRGATTRDREPRAAHETHETHLRNPSHPWEGPGRCLSPVISGLSSSTPPGTTKATDHHGERAQGDAAGGEKKVGHGALERWTERRALLLLGVSSLDPHRTDGTPAGQPIRSDAIPAAYLCQRQISHFETEVRQPRQEDSAAWAWLRGARRTAAPLPRFAGNLGPSLFMTAVERRDQQQQGREALERLGRHCRRMAGLTAEERARNDLPPPQSLREALASPTGRFADLLAQGLREGAEHGDGATKAHARARLQAGGLDGLDPGAKSAHTPNTYGWRGLTAAGRRAIKDAAAVMDDHYGTLGFWTVTLPEAAAATATRAQVADFQSRLLFFARRMMLRRGVDPFAVVVCELHPGRRAMDGARVPHWHAIVKVARRPFEKWAVSVADWHRVVDAAHFAAFGARRGGSQGCKMLPQKTGAARYLAKYMSKGASEAAPLQGTIAGRMVPRQWWTWTGEVRALVQKCRVRPPSAFLSWCCRWRRELEDLGELAQSGPVHIGEDGPEVGRWFVWSSEAALDRAIEGWMEAELERLDELRLQLG